MGDVLSDHGDSDAFGGVLYPAHEALPFVHVGFLGPHVQILDDYLRESLLLVYEGNLVYVLDVLGGDDRLSLDVAEKRYLSFHLVGEELVLGAAEKYVGLDSYLEKLLHAVLGRFRLELPRGGDVGNVGKVDEEGVLPSDVGSQLPHGLEKGKTLYVADRAADFDYYHVVVVLEGEHPRLYLVGYVGDHLDRLSKKLPLPLLGDHRMVDLSTGEVVFLAEPSPGEPLVVTEVKVGLRPVVGDENLAVLERIHRSRVDVYVGVELLEGHPKAAALQEKTDRGSGDSLSEGRHDAARNENELGPFQRIETPLFFRRRQDGSKKARPEPKYIRFAGSLQLKTGFQCRTEAESAVTARAIHCDY